MKSRSQFCGNPNDLLGKLQHKLSLILNTDNNRQTLNLHRMFTASIPQLIRDEAIVILCKFIRNNTQIVKLIFTQNFMTNQNIIDLYDAIESNKSLRYLDLGNSHHKKPAKSKISNLSLIYFPLARPPYSTRSSSYIGNQSVHHVHLNKLISLIKNRDFECLTINNLNLYLPQLIALLNVIENNLSIKHLSMDISWHFFNRHPEFSNDEYINYYQNIDNYINAYDKQLSGALTQLLCKNKTIVSFSLTSNQKHQYNMAMLIEGLKGNCNIFKLALYVSHDNEKYSATYFDEFIEFLKINKHIISLNLGKYKDCRLNHADALKFVEMLKVNLVITEFNFAIDLRTCTTGQASEIYKTIDELCLRNKTMHDERFGYIQETNHNILTGKTRTIGESNLFKCNRLQDKDLLPNDMKVLEMQTFCKLNLRFANRYLFERNSLLATLSTYHWFKFCPMYGIAKDASGSIFCYEFGQDIVQILIDKIKFSVKYEVRSIDNCSNNPTNIR